jgi:hypothetical protein
MSNEYLDNAIVKAKEVLDVAVKKTEEVVTVKKLEYNLLAARSSREKDLAALGRIYYKILKGSQEMDEESKVLFDSITEKTSKINQIKEEISNAKNKKYCSNCGTFVTVDSAYCKNCGNEF